MATGPASAVVVLPPRPRRRDWLVAGACAGLCLGIAELLLAVPSGLALPPPLALALVAAAAAPVAVLAAALGLALHGCGVRVTQSALVGALVAPLLLVAGLAPAWHWIARLARPEALEAGILAGTALLATGAGLAAAGLAGRGERAGFASSGLLLWGGTALLVAASGRGLEASSRLAGSPSSGLWLGALLAALACAGIVLVVRRRGSARRPFARLLGGLVLLAFGVCFWPWLRPWILFGPELPSFAPGPPNLLVLALGAGPAEAAPPDARGVARSRMPPALEILAYDGITYEALRAAPGATGGAPLALPDGGRLVLRLRDAGYATAAFFAEPTRAPAVEAARVDVRPGPGRLLEDLGHRLTGAPLLRGPGAPLLGWLGLDARTRSAEQLRDEAERWLLEWRATRVPAPFFLYLDFGSPDAAGLAAADAAIGALLEALGQLGALANTLVVVTLEGDRGAPDPPRSVWAVVRPPPLWSRQPLGLAVVRPVAGERLAAALLRTTTVEGPTAVPLPGVDPELWRAEESDATPQAARPRRRAEARR